MPESNSQAQWNTELLESMRMEQDPVADDFVARLVAETDAATAMALFNQLIHDVDIPIPDREDWIGDYFADTAKLPDWADAAQIKMGQEVFADFGPSMLVLLFFKSLPTTYLCWRGAQALWLTGRLTDSGEKLARYSRRIAETAQFVLDVMSPGGLEAGGRGIRTAQKIRLVHASVRTFIPEKEWDEAQWQRPINQEDMAMTILNFSISLIDGLKQYGVELSPERAEAFLHAWKVVAHVMGLRPELQPANVADGRNMLEAILSSQSGASDAGRELSEALVQFGRELIPGKVLDRGSEFMIRYFIGADRARTLGIQTESGCMAAILPAVIKKWMGFIEKLEDDSRPLEEILNLVNRAVMKAIVSYIRDSKGAGIVIPDDLKAKWELT